MISFSLKDVRKPTTPELENSSKKRKLEEPLGDEETNFEKRSKAESTKSMFYIELHLETPLPLEWQRCLDIQSGQIHFYNRRTHPESPSAAGHHVSLDLELNLPCDSVRKIDATDHYHQFNKHSSVSPRRASSVDKKIHSSTGGLMQNLPCLAVEDEDEQEQQDMIATVCMRCHMLVMLCKSSPACPNCKFMHPPDQGPPKLFKQRLSLCASKDQQDPVKVLSLA